MFLKKRVVKLLSGVEAFQGLNEEELEPFARACRKVAVREGETLVEEGDPAPGFHVVAEGTFRVFLPETIKGRKEHRISEVKLNRLREGDCFGEYSLMDRRPASASVRAASQGEVVQITEEDFLRILEGNDRIGRIVYRNLLRVLVRRLRKREKEYDLVIVPG